MLRTCGTHHLRHSFGLIRSFRHGWTLLPMMLASSSRWAAGLATLGLLCAVACGAVYPELSTPVRPASAQQEPEPAPPSDVIYVDFIRAHVPKQTRDGREWNRSGAKGPDSFAKFIVDGRDVLVTPITPNSLEPTWPNQQRANYRIPRGAEIRIELWDAKTIKDRPICLKRLSNIHDAVSPAPVEVVCEKTGTRILMNILPARPLLGLGLYYELQGAGQVAVTRVIEESPAGRAGVTRGTRILTLQGRSVAELDALEVKSLVNANARTGVEMDLLFPDGRRKSVTLKEEAMYPLLAEGLDLEQPR